jgi:hypothetical protein
MIPGNSWCLPFNRAVLVASVLVKELFDALHCTPSASPVTKPELHHSYLLGVNRKKNIRIEVKVSTATKRHYGDVPASPDRSVRNVCLGSAPLDRSTPQRVYRSRLVSRKAQTDLSYNGTRNGSTPAAHEVLILVVR